MVGKGSIGIIEGRKKGDRRVEKTSKPVGRAEWKLVVAAYDLKM